MADKKWKYNAYIVMCNPQPEVYNVYASKITALARARSLLKFRTEILDKAKIPYSVINLFTTPEKQMRNSEFFAYYHKAVIYNKIIKINEDFKQKFEKEKNLQDVLYYDNCVIKVERVRVY